MDDVALISPPAVEPVTTAEMKKQARVYHSLDDDYIATDIIPSARARIETEVRRALVTQTWLLKLDHFPGFDSTYVHSGYPELVLPKPPFQQVLSFTYVDTAGVTQTLNPTGPDGVVPLVNGSDPFYGYQLDPGSETQPARLLPPWARPWPPTRLVPMGVQVKFVAGYGTLISIGIAQGTNAITGFKFFASDVGLPITIAGAGTPNNATSPATPTDLVTTIASVDTNGNATTADAAGATVSGVSQWWRRAIPLDLKKAILLQGAHYYNNREATSTAGEKPLVLGVEDLIGPWVNQIA
jgi:hypothetical protein